MEALCLITNITASIHFSFQECFFTAFPINRHICKEIDSDRDIVYHLYTRQNINDSHILKIGNDSLLQNSHADWSKPTIIFIHGFLESYESDDAQRIKNNYLTAHDGNVILVDAKYLFAGPWYLTSAWNVEIVGEYTAAFVDYLSTKGLKLSDLHIVGMSLGGQTAGYIGQSVKSGKIGRITGLDPAGPLFFGRPVDQRLDKSDAEFVDIIHSNAGIFGYNADCGDVDFWINGGTFQPGCSPLATTERHPLYIPLLVFCNHWRSYQVFSEALLNEKQFPAQKCDNYVSYQLGRCKANETVYVGLDLSANTTGNFYLNTPSRGSYII